MTQPARLQQLPLAFRLNERLDLDLFVAGPNATVCERLRRLAAGEPAQMYLWGGSGSGKTHLLQAACRLASQHDRRGFYVPLAGLIDREPVILEGLEEFDLVAIDDLQTVAGRMEWQRTLYDFYNRVLDHNRSLLFAAPASPRGLDLQLPDLVSRLGWGLVFHLRPLTDDQKCEALMRRAAARGLDLPDEVAAFLLRRTARDIVGLMTWLDHLDQAQLAAQRRLSIPFVKSLLKQPERPA